MNTIKLMADYQCWPLWKASPGEVGNINPTDLPISQELCERLLEWSLAYGETLNIEDPANSGFESIEAEDEFKKEGRELAELLREELGPNFSFTTKL